MYRRTKKWTWVRAQGVAQLTALLTNPAAALMPTPNAVLFTAGAPFTPASTFAGLTLAAFTGYAAVVITAAFSVPVVLGSNDLGIIASANFIGGAGLVAPGETVIGYAVTDGAVGLYGGEIFEDPVIFGAPGAFLNLDIVIPFPLVYTPMIL